MPRECYRVNIHPACSNWLTRSSIKLAHPIDAPAPVFAVKLIHKGYALKRGHISEKQLRMEVSIHNYVGQHPNIIEWFASGDDPNWVWIAMEYAEGGDLFDKIEADVGVPEDIAQIYFLQLVSGVSFIHSKGVAHRDLKPENILMSADGILKIADFGMATMFAHKGQRKLSTTLCGSPPYIAPEILLCRREDGRKAPHKYDPEMADIWSCGVILFVLLVGNTPWDEPSVGSWEFQEYKRQNGHSTDPLWERIPPDALSLLRGMMNLDQRSRFTWPRIRQHPWYTRKNKLLNENGKVADPIVLATQMLENLRIDFSQAPPPTQSTTHPDGMDIDSGAGPGTTHMAASQPEVVINDSSWAWERPTLRSMANLVVSSTQPVTRNDVDMRLGNGHSRQPLDDFVSFEPSITQFSQQPAPMTLTQQARRFRDIVPPESLTRFFSHVPPVLLVQMISDALHQLNIPLPPVRANGDGSDKIATIRVRAVDGRKQNLHGEIQIDKHHLANDMELLDVRFIKVKGDPLEWRRFFKKVVVLCKDGVYVPDA